MFRRAMLPPMMLGLVMAIPMGCGPSGGPRPPMGKVSGKVSYKGAPVPRGTISFSPVRGEKGNQSSIGAVGTIGSDGTFELTTFNTGDGAVVGQHTVTISVQDDGAPALKNMPSNPLESVKVAQQQNLIPKIYTDPDKTPLKYTVEPGTNNFDINLKD
jgi:hypothetical protein